MDVHKRPLTRREVLRYGAGGLAGLTLAPWLAACGGDDKSSSTSTTSSAASSTATTGSKATAGSTIKMWWWGEQEAVGIQKWVDETIAGFKTAEDVTVDPTLMDTAQVIPQFTNAAASGNVPDVQFLFNGIYHMENVWLGYLDPLNELVSADVLENSGATAMSVFEGKQYRTGFYSVGFGVAYNKEHFDKAGLSPDTPPATWDEFMDASDKLKTAGYIPLGGGVKDGFLGEWYLVLGLGQNLDTPKDALDLFIGNLDWEDPKYYEHWSKLEELKKAGYINDDAGSIELYQGVQKFETGKASMTINTTPALPNSQQKVGAENLGYMVMPVFGTGAMAGKPTTDTQGFGIPSKAKDKGSAAAFLEYMQQPEQLQAMWTTSKQIPAGANFDSSVIDDAFIKGVYDKWVGGDKNAYIADLMPTLFWTDAMFVASQKILGGTMTGEEAGTLAKQVTEKWKKQNPDTVEKYTTWGADLSA